MICDVEGCEHPLAVTSRGWCSAPVCSTHDWIPTIPDEKAEFDEHGELPCIPAVRLWVPDSEASS